MCKGLRRRESKVPITGFPREGMTVGGPLEAAPAGTGRLSLAAQARVGKPGKTTDGG